MNGMVGYRGCNPPYTAIYHAYIPVMNKISQSEIGGLSNQQHVRGYQVPFIPCSGQVRILQWNLFGNLLACLAFLGHAAMRYGLI